MNPEDENKEHLAAVLQGIPDDKAEEIWKLFELLTQKYEVLKMLRDIPYANRSLEKELSEKYYLGDRSSPECDLGSATLFGLSNIVFQSQGVERKKCEKCKNLPAEKYNRGISVKEDNRADYIKAHLDLLKLKLQVHHERTLTRAAAEQYLGQLMKAQALQQRKRDALMHAAGVVCEKANVLVLDTQISTNEAALEYFTEDKVILEATQKLREVKEKKIQELKFAIVEAEAQLAMYRKLEDTDFKDIVREYIEVSEAVDQKKWAIGKIKEEQDSFDSESIKSARLH